ncbi:unnamed protein product [Larinioides sclopetarius]|uniref:Uncharacterized protein n=1 Tax=Larinioides sclopetarius TaxID=280406 RepID=A0AAV1ZAM3_9ARAC
MDANFFFQFSLASSDRPASLVPLLACGATKFNAGYFGAISHGPPTIPRLIAGCMEVRNRQLTGHTPLADRLFIYKYQYPEIRCDWTGKYDIAVTGPSNPL